MSGSPRKKQRIGDRRLGIQDELQDSTLHDHLQQLTSILPKPSTPFRRASSAGPRLTPSDRRTPNIPIRTPGAAARTPRGGLASRPISARRAAPTTPHAIRALRERANAARTPGQNRRRSGRVQRETPRDTLRDLSRILARDTRPVRPSPPNRNTSRNSALELADIDDGPDPIPPRLSMALEDMYEDDSIHEMPPRQSLLPDIPADVDNGTIQSLEFGRRAVSEDPRAMFAARISERFADLQELGIEEEEYELDGTFINSRPQFDPDLSLQEEIEEEMEDTTMEARGLAGIRGGRHSDAGLGVFEQDEILDEPTFRFTIPQRLRTLAREEQVEQDPTVQGFSEIEDSMNLEKTLHGGSSNGSSTDHAGQRYTNDEPAPVAWESDEELDNDADLHAYREEVSAVDRSLQTESPERRPVAAAQHARRQRREVRISKFGNEYASFPAPTIKRLATSFAKIQGGHGKISNDTLTALVQATDWFFEQVSEDLSAYAAHAGRKMIENGDVIALMKRQRQITNNTTSFSLAQKMLPRELLQELRMEPVQKAKRAKRKRMQTVVEDDEQEEHA
ncbi:hypothetical protein BU24DRAFT_487988 [Aaosphaeria arxii CBS 175.79]|uniref:CENP-T/Histone H4 histone fold domain-containing protein n=1 Tax=Aaosphaeria arxii CBS 175.79 TaxID=1450172 RepID=A0A6A5Y8E0_9PLEO|nr:uncharacterized protein BU24DRAFT_487988 [Aaosphaeria arxii CBS 175.79]KAF2021599.1 hypothetical protein BU24DRAFT_487988 [Aaosphaeria arxii CBS 175.79]